MKPPPTHLSYHVVPLT